MTAAEVTFPSNFSTQKAYKAARPTLASLSKAHISSWRFGNSAQPRVKSNIKLHLHSLHSCISWNWSVPICRTYSLMTKTAFHLQTNEDTHNEHMLEMQSLFIRFFPYSFRSCIWKFCKETPCVQLGQEITLKGWKIDRNKNKVKSLKWLSLIGCYNYN